MHKEGKNDNLKMLYPKWEKFPLHHIASPCPQPKKVTNKNDLGITNWCVIALTKSISENSLKIVCTIK